MDKYYSHRWECETLTLFGVPVHIYSKQNKGHPFSEMSSQSIVNSSVRLGMAFATADLHLE